MSTDASQNHSGVCSYLADPKSLRGHPFMTSTQRESGGSGGHMQMGEGSAPCGRPHRKLEPTDFIPPSSHAQKLAFFCTRVSSLDRIKGGNISLI